MLNLEISNQNISNQMKQVEIDAAIKTHLQIKYEQNRSMHKNQQHKSNFTLFQH